MGECVCVDNTSTTEMTNCAARFVRKDLELCSAAAAQAVGSIPDVSVLEDDFLGLLRDRDGDAPEKPRDEATTRLAACPPTWWQRAGNSRRGVLVNARPSTGVLASYISTNHLKNTLCFTPLCSKGNLDRLSNRWLALSGFPRHHQVAKDAPWTDGKGTPPNHQRWCGVSELFNSLIL